MRNAFISILAAALLVAGVSVAKADTFSVFADLPIDATIKFQDSDLKADGVSGFKIGVTFPIFLGLALEEYTIKLSDDAKDYDISFFDVFFNLPLPIVNIAVGVGVGQGKPQGKVFQEFYQEAPLTQFWASLGFPILPLLDVHLAYHSFKGRHPTRDKDFADDLNVEGTMISVGAKLGF